MSIHIWRHGFCYRDGAWLLRVCVCPLTKGYGEAANGSAETSSNLGEWCMCVCVCVRVIVLMFYYVKLRWLMQLTETTHMHVRWPLKQGLREFPTRSSSVNTNACAQD